MNHDQLTAAVLAQIESALTCLKAAHLGHAMRHLNKARALLRAARACQRIDQDAQTGNEHPTPPPAA